MGAECCALLLAVFLPAPPLLVLFLICRTTMQRRMVLPTSLQHTQTQAPTHPHILSVRFSLSASLRMQHTPNRQNGLLVATQLPFIPSSAVPHSTIAEFLQGVVRGRRSRGEVYKRAKRWGGSGCLSYSPCAGRVCVWGGGSTVMRVWVYVWPTCARICTLKHRTLSCTMPA